MSTKIRDGETAIKIIFALLRGGGIAKSGGRGCLGEGRHVWEFQAKSGSSGSCSREMLLIAQVPNFS